eukprot:CAMPEP_0202963824 /NCGR_PEP_ID=MMETSP1396-20130829/7856_1 /ASSEMBLY_ACC=CAM_ASM_000872 /TAXON_ID= /ORGANISM="Pseudokeronopsis sp., Strain Brazil" /LENGTH=228 /DNA_ID=CAMNT_0049685385 /DNA_START=16 /DNA_END=702 /DNA_ORIENTATION=+
MKEVMVLVLTFAAVVLAGSAPVKGGMTGDIFVFAQSWQPGFCSGKVGYVGCDEPKEYWRKFYTIHGLWPQYNGGGYPQACTTEAFNSSIPELVGWNEMVTFWPNAQYAETDPSYSSFWEHEWSKHGTCSGLSQYDYFSNTIDLLKKFGTPSLISTNTGGSVNAAELRASYGGSTMVALQCNTGNNLSGVYTCWSQTNGKPVGQVVCPPDVQLEDTCTSSETIYVEAFK